MIWLKLFEILTSFVAKIVGLTIVLFTASFLWLYAIPYGKQQFESVNRLEQQRAERDRLAIEAGHARSDVKSAADIVISLQPDKPPIFFTWEYWPVVSRIQFELVGATTAELKLALKNFSQKAKLLAKIEGDQRRNQSEIARLETGVSKFVEAIKATAYIMSNWIASIIAIVIVGPYVGRLLKYCLVKWCLPRVSAIQLDNHSPSLSPINCGDSSRGLTVPVLTNRALLARAEWVEERDENVATYNRFFWKWSSPAISFISGMVPCTRIERKDPSIDTGIRLTSGQQNDYLTSIKLADDQKICLRPSCIVAVTEGIAIETRWRLGSLHAWLTGQLRFVMLSGPGSIYVCGSGGIEASRVDKSGKTMASNCVVGFQPSLHYSAAVANNFLPFFFGKVPLLQNQFEGSGTVIRLLTADNQRSSFVQKATGHVFSALGKLLGF